MTKHDKITGSITNHDFPSHSTPLTIRCPNTPSYLAPLAQYLLYYQKLLEHWGKGVKGEGMDDISEVAKAQYKGDSSSGSGTSNNKGPQASQTAYLLTPSEYHLLLSRSSLNPIHPYRMLADATHFSYHFFPLFEYDYSWEFELEVKKEVSELKTKYTKLIDDLKRTPQYWRLNDRLRRDIQGFGNTSVFENRKERLFASSLLPFLPTLDPFYLPIIPGLSYEEVRLLILKLVLLGWITLGNESNNAVEGGGGNNTQKEWDEWEKDYEEDKWTQIQSKLEEWLEDKSSKSGGSSSSQESPKPGLSLPFGSTATPTDPKYSQNPLSYLLSTFLADKDLKKQNDIDNRDGLEKVDIREGSYKNGSEGQNGNGTNDEFKKWCGNGANGNSIKKRSTDSKDSTSTQPPQCPNLVWEKLRKSESGGGKNKKRSVRETKKDSENNGPKLSEYLPKVLKSWIKGDYWG